MLTGEPSYTSAVHRWKGTIDILNAIPAKKKINPKICRLALPKSDATSLKYNVPWFHRSLTNRKAIHLMTMQRIK